MQHIPQPLFAPASQRAENDDYDLNEIFAEYFSNEFDTDPMNAYTDGMANFNSGGGVVSAAGLGPLGGFLPTGGIRTAFHVGGSANNNNNSNLTNGGVVGVAGLSGMGGVVGGAMIGGGIAGSIGPTLPAAKKQKHDDSLLGQLGQQQQSMMPQQQQQQQLPLGMGGGMGVAGMNLGGGLGVAGMGMGLIDGQQQVLMLQQQQLQQQQQQQQQQQPAPLAPQQQSQQQQVILPVGVGIRLGGVGGVVATPQVTAAAGMAAQQQLQHFMWAQQQGLGGGGLGDGMDSEVGVAERRQRNREHAKRSRVRKKFMLESMQEEVRQLQKENQALRMLIQEHIPEHAMQIISECCTGNPLFDDSDMGGSEDGDDEGGGGCSRKADHLVKSDLTLMQSLAAGQQCFVLSDPKLPDNPIVFASPGFYKLTGYTSKEVLGRNCRFLQGEGTDKRAVDIIRKAIETGSDATVCLLNYKADGTPFWNQFFLASLRDSDNNIVNYVGVMTEVEPDAGANALEEKVNAVLPLQAKDDKDQDSS